LSAFFLKITSLLGFSAVCLGAFGGHVLKSRLPSDLFDIFEIGVRYHFYHTVALLVLCFAPPVMWEKSATLWAATSWSVGIVLFSGSLYVLALTGMRVFGMVTPLGGVAFLVGWLALFVAAFQTRG
jgi:uncharacterized membrane protein YgdD (TMEM256/DUF423 family)